MIFADILFLFAFLPICFILYFLSKSIKWRNSVLIFVSLVFYAFGKPLYIPLFLASIVVNYFLALGINKNTKDGE